jgi:16S rRNA (cytidine1402-2'-O)-methyltransferase
MTDSVTPAFDLMTQQLNQQDLPVGSLYVVATPIGNMGDITFRAAHILKNMDGIACEDTRHTAPLLKHLGINKPLLALHEHNEREASNKVVEYLKAGQRWAYVSDAGTPGISDPGAHLAQVCADNGLRVLPIPGASAVSAIASVAGDALSTSDGKFQFLGFFPVKTKDQASFLANLEQAMLGTIFYESPHRIADTLKVIDSSLIDRGRHMVIGRELTKKFETIDHLTIADISAWLAKQDGFRGEFAILIGAPRGKDRQNAEGSFEVVKLINELSKHLGSKQIAEIVSHVSTISKKDAYQLALDTKKPAKN